MTKNTVKRAAESSGGYVIRPPIEKREAEAILQNEIPDETWLQIIRAFAEFGWHLRALNTTPENKTREGWDHRQAYAAQAIEAAMQKVEKVRTRHGDFLHDASENYSLKTRGQSCGSSMNANKLLNEAYDRMLHALTIVERAEPQSIETPTVFEARRTLFREVRDAMQAVGLDCKLSRGQNLPDEPSEADLTPFEQLVSALEINDSETPLAASKWMQRAALGTQ